MTVPVTTCKVFPHIKSKCLPYKSLILGNIVQPNKRPRKYNDPKRPNVLFGAHYRLFYSTQLYKVVEELVSNLYSSGKAVLSSSYSSSQKSLLVHTTHSSDGWYRHKYYGYSS